MLRKSVTLRKVLRIPLRGAKMNEHVTGKHDQACSKKVLRYARSFVCLWRGAKMDEHGTGKDQVLTQVLSPF